MTCSKCGYTGQETGICPRCGGAATPGPIDPLAELGSLYTRSAPTPRAALPRVPGPGGVPGKRPTAMTVIGWLFIIGSAFMILSAGMGLWALSLMRQTTGGRLPPLPPDAPAMFRVMYGLLPYFWLLGRLQIAFALFVIFAALQFLRRRAWARTALESVTWLGLVFAAGFTLLWAASWVSMASTVPAQPGAPSPMFFTIVGVVIAVVVAAVWATPLIVILVFLRGRTIREVVRELLQKHG